MCRRLENYIITRGFSALRSRETVSRVDKMRRLMRQSGGGGLQVGKHEQESFRNMYLNVGLEDIV